MRPGGIAIVDYVLRECIVSKPWGRRRDGYAVSWFRMQNGGRKLLSMHRYLYALVNGPIPKGMVIDHINGDKLDNRLSNLRCVTLRENARNLKCHRDGRELYATKSIVKRYRGVVWYKHKPYNVGTFDTVEKLLTARANKLLELETMSGTPYDTQQ